MPFLEKYPIVAQYLPTPSGRRRGHPLVPGVRFVVAHDTGNPNTSAAQNVHYFASTPNPKTVSSAHLFVDDREIIECIPALTGPPEKAWHVLYSVQTDNRLYGFNANDAAIGVEYCYGTHIDADAAYDRYVWVLAYLCYRFKLDPAKAIVGHFMLDPHRKTDPATGLAHSRRSYEQLLRDVVDEYRACGGALPDAPAAAPTRAVAQGGTAVATVRLNLRAGAPSRRAPVVRVVEVGETLPYVAVVDDGEAVNGRSDWCRDADNHFFWRGGVRVE